MSRSGYSEDCEQWDLIRWRGAVASAIRGKRGQAFLREALAALDALPVQELIAHDLIVYDYDPLTQWLFAPVVQDVDEPWRKWDYEDRWRRAFGASKGGVCLLGAVGVAREAPISTVDPEDRESVAALFEIPHTLACEIMWENDDGGRYDETPRARWERMRRWIVANLRDDQPETPPPTDAARSAAHPKAEGQGPGSAS